jgi:hypothetical protein
MTDKTITTYYKWLSIMTLLVSIVGTIMLIEGTKLEKLGIGVLVNLQFHMAFQFLSRVPFGMYSLVENDNKRKRAIGQKILKFFSVFIMIGAVIAFLGMLKSVIVSQDYSQLIVTMTFLAMFSRWTFIEFKTPADLMRSTTQAISHGGTVDINLIIGVPPRLIHKHWR